MSQGCSLGVGCDETGVCYAEAHGQPENCGHCLPPSKLASRHNAGKSPLSMILEARHALEGMAGVLEFGAKKYARGNWHKGLPHADICDSLLRHLSAYLSGEDIDPESGKPHVDHIFCNAMFLAEGYRTHPELDNRSEELKRAE